MPTQTQPTFLNITYKNDYAIVQLHRGRANVLNHQMVNEIRQTFKNLAVDDAVRGVIITGQPHFFSAGLDVIELYDYNAEKIGDFFFDFGTMFIELAKFPKPFLSAISGHSPAGGTVIAICTDYRIMVAGPKYTIGLNEVAVNILISENIAYAYGFWLGKRQAYHALLAGKLFPVQEAHEVGLVDEVCEAEELMERAEQKMKQWLRANDDILLGTKKALRAEFYEKIDLDVRQAIHANMDTWWKPEIRARMKTFVDGLKSRK